MIPITAAIASTVLHSYNAQLAFEEQALRDKIAISRIQVQNLTSQLIALESPSSLHKQALELGMVPTDRMLFIDIHKGEIIGSKKRINSFDITQPSKPMIKPYYTRELLKHPSQFPVDDSAVLIYTRN